MNIAMVVPGGVDRSAEFRVIPALLSLMRQLALRHELHVFSLAPGVAADAWQWSGVSIHQLGRARSVPRAVAAIRREHRVGPFDVIQSLWAGWPGTVAVIAGHLLQVPSCVHVAGGELCGLTDIGYGGSLRWYGRLRERWVLRGAAAVSAASRPILDQISNLGVVAERIPLGVDTAVWPVALPRRRTPGEVARLIHVASLNRVKDQRTLLEAMRILMTEGVRFSLDIVGEDTLQGEVQAFARSAGLAEQVRFHGFLTQSRLRPVMEAAHLNLVSSRHEAGPLVALEAAIAGVPSVSTAVGHPSEWTPEAASCVPVGDAARFAVAVRTLLDDEDRRLQMAKCAQQRAFSEDALHTAAMFEATYQRLRA